MSNNDPNPADYATWCERYGGDYTSSRERRRGYRDYRANHADITNVFTNTDHPLVFMDQLDGLRALADEVLSTMEAAGDVLLPPEPTIYSQCGKKPVWPLWAAAPFEDWWTAKIPHEARL